MPVETAYAKVNLALHVRVRRADGYHALESLFAFCADGDRLTAEARDDGALTLSITGPFGAALGTDDDNLVLRAARALRDAAGIETGIGAGAALTLDKRLPIASGIGGGSADAAAALRLLMRLWDIDPAAIDLSAIAQGLGADVPACLGSVTVFGEGVGERLRPVDAPVDARIGGTCILLVNPLVACPTGPVFRAWDGVDRGALSPDGWRAGRNDLQPPALTLVPEIAAVLAALEALPGATVPRMSGSGATCFALFADECARDRAQEAIRTDHSGWWTLGSILR
ncbi:4-(cytidine 5'-diphospho)-2-C-methyl-D-erythritol kinase [Sphingobium sufflavum]|uniref:4-(cytidine 5'-diphospho)-2-C-methyl-D-erythritol kinase n=1 Tax=Sphingobium sufflavum TaxID=1129547 RepID=UPI001F187C34|nr:4-(cytidine 5'-diphospho)-2-C-methyl-D-erythritol kinase [Sphingobium sufflavum]MCE7798550.1 4-(cytidine 5'-diphospho)-2-C-methyl-D-erythritol kinase [Sphingobium sufflavum]